jgi:tetratricopeptide (TPR) repeat protein
MTPERWHQLKTLFGRALELEADERSRFIAEATAGDTELQSSLRSLIGHEETATCLLDGPILSQERITEYLAAGVRTFHEGEVVSGRFRIAGFLGEGGMGEVYRVEDLELGGFLALKTLRPVLSSDERLILRFKQETQTARQVTHRNVSRIFDLFHYQMGSGPESRTVAFLTMEFLDGETLAARIARDGPIPPAEALRIVEQIAHGLAAAHSSGIVHRDLKSGNVLLVKDEQTGMRAVITDFGLACPKDPPGAAGSGKREVAGTLAYAAPEQLTGGAITAASDIYSFGIVIFEMVTGKLPFRQVTLAEAVQQRLQPPPSPRKIARNLGPRWESVILACLDADPARRPPTAEDVVRRLRSNAIARRRLLAGSAAAAAAGIAVWYAARPRPLNPEAIKSFRRGQDFAQRRNEEGLRNAIGEFQQATKLEPGYAAAWVGIADAYSAMANFDFVEPKEALATARQAATRALSLDGNSGRALGVMGYVTSLDVERWRKAEPYFQRAVAADPKDSTIRLWYGAHLSKLGRSGDALRQLRIGLELDPMSLTLNQQLATEYFRARRFAEYYAQARELVRLQPFEASSHLALARALEWQGRFQEALAECSEARKYSASVTSLAFRGCIEAALGDLAAARKDAAQVRAYWSSRPFQTMLLASLYCRIGELDTAVEMLNQGYERGDSTILTAPFIPYLDPLKDDAGFIRFLHRLGWNR